ncbi:MAG: hypothetical protein LBR10_09675 [Prevotellaceae bacterium]|nr:hypothetical protein [Prevotellaceae bacterium]
MSAKSYLEALWREATTTFPSFGVAVIATPNEKVAKQPEELSLRRTKGT